MQGMMKGRISILEQKGILNLSKKIQATLKFILRFHKGILHEKTHPLFSEQVTISRKQSIISRK